ncbi:MAG: hypothetical protein K2W96_14805 [Gemmataceae bacterium]|nr:hypothetical protein [Gemmataceae bacterium]
MRAVWRYLVMAAFVFWLGGVTFYMAVVVPIGTEVLESGRRQGFITRRVTGAINLAAAAALALLLLDLLASPGRRRWRVGLWLVMAACQAALFWLHGVLDAHLDPSDLSVADQPAFWQRHRVYLWLHTAQWLAALGFLWLLTNGAERTPPP